LSAVFDGLKVPVPLVVQTPPPATVMIPFNVTVALFAHTVWFGPALAVGASVNVIVT